MTKIFIRYQTVIREIVELPDDYDKDLQILNGNIDGDADISLNKLYDYIDKVLPSDSVLYGIYDKDYTFAYCEC
jgi:hypothetical protein